MIASDGHNTSVTTAGAWAIWDLTTLTACWHVWHLKVKCISMSHIWVDPYFSTIVDGRSLRCIHCVHHLNAASWIGQRVTLASNWWRECYAIIPLFLSSKGYQEAKTLCPLWFSIKYTPWTRKETKSNLLQRWLLSWNVSCEPLYCGGWMCRRSARPSGQ